MEQGSLITQLLRTYGLYLRNYSWISFRRLRVIKHRYLMIKKEQSRSGTIDQRGEVCHTNLRISKRLLTQESEAKSQKPSVFQSPSRRHRYGSKTRSDRSTSARSRTPLYSKRRALSTTCWPEGESRVFFKAVVQNCRTDSTDTT